MSISEEKDVRDERTGDGKIDSKTTIVTEVGEVVNASGHRDQLNRQYGLLSICGLALTVDNAWVAIGTSLTVAIGTTVVFHIEASLIVCSQPMAVLLEFFTNSSWPYSTTSSSHYLLQRYVCWVQQLYSAHITCTPACLIGSVCRRSLSLGFHYTWTPIWTSHRVLYRLLELFWLDIRSVVYFLHYV